MRTSIAALALITRRRGGEIEYLAQWNLEWTALHFVGGHKHQDETFRECVLREIGEELGVVPGGFSMADDPTARLHYVATSRRAGAETDYTVELFDVELKDEALSGVEQRPENAWLGSGEIAVGAAHDGRAISPTMSLLLGKTGRLPVVRNPQVFAIGVTGHRDLRSDDRAAISRTLTAVFAQAEREAGGRTIEALSPLAAGADQLFAQQALARSYRLIAPLPVPLDLYRRDFRRERGGEFERLLLRASEWYSLPLGVPARRDSQAVHETETCLDGLERPSSADDFCRADVAVYGPARDHMYEAVGRYLVERSDLLIALWDGQTNGKQGGTGEMVTFARRAVEAGQALRIEVVPVRRECQI